MLGALFTPEDNARGVRLGLAEAIHSGITTVHNWSHNICRRPMPMPSSRCIARPAAARAISYGYSRKTGTNEMLPLDDVRASTRNSSAQRATVS